MSMNLPIAAKAGAMFLPPLPALRDFVNMYRLNAKKILSQNYLMDMNLTRKLVRKAGDMTDHYVIEIGPGPGGITRAVLEDNCRRLDVIEIDDRFIPPLEILRLASSDRLHIHHKNVMKADMAAIWRKADVPTTSWYDDINEPPLHVVGNLPFNIASPLIIKLLKDMSYRRGAWAFGRVPLTLTFQKEVAHRIVSGIDSESRSRISLMAQYVSKPRLLFILPGECFVPAPQVDVGVVRFEPRMEPLIPAPFELIEKVARILFMHRRKGIVKNLTQLYPKPIQKEMTHELLKHCGVHPDVICAQVGIEELNDMCLYYIKQCNEMPGLYLYDYSKKVTIQELKDLPNAIPPPYAFAGLKQVEQGISFAEFGKQFGNV